MFLMKCLPINIRKIIMSIWQNRFLIKITIIRDIQIRYRGSLIGIVWSLIHPLFMLIVYTFFFSEIFNTSWHSYSKSKGEFSLILFIGLIMFNFFSECLNKAPKLILTNANFVKKIVFPLEILPIVLIGSAFFHMVISFVVWIIAYFEFFGIPHLTILYFPLVLMPLPIMALGISWILASLGVFFRDISQFITLFTSALMFLSPVFYSADIFPPKFRHLIYFNPLTTVIEQTRNTLYWGKNPDFTTLGIYWFCAFIIVWMGFSYFKKMQKGFADVL